MEISDIINFEKIISIASAIDGIDELDNNRLVIEYKLPENVHRKLDEDLYYRSNKENPFEHNDEILAEIGGIVFRFIIE